MHLSVYFKINYPYFLRENKVLKKNVAKKV